MTIDKAKWCLVKVVTGLNVSFVCRTAKYQGGEELTKNGCITYYRALNLYNSCPYSEYKTDFLMQIGASLGAIITGGKKMGYWKAAENLEEIIRIWAENNLTRW